MDKETPSKKVPFSSMLQHWPKSEGISLPLPPTLPSKKPWPKISVIIPFQNKRLPYEETLLSVLKQDYPQLELIVVVEKGAETLTSLLEEQKGQITKISSEKGTLVEMINQGLNHANGEVFTWLCGGDMLAPQALSATALFWDFSSADIYTGICHIYDKSQILRSHFTLTESGSLSLKDLLDPHERWETDHFFLQPGVFFTQKIWGKSGGHLDASLQSAFDYELWLRMAKSNAKLEVLGRPLAFYYQKNNQEPFQSEISKKELAICRQRYEAVPYEVERNGFSKMLHTLKILLVNDIGPQYGAGIAHARLGEALSLAGHQVDFIKLGEFGEYTAKIEEVATSEILERIDSLQPDVVIIGNLHGAKVSPGLGAAIAQKYPTLFIIHDLWALTGRCSYNGECQKYLTGCDETCPSAYEYPIIPIEKIHEAWRAKMLGHFQEKPMMLVGNTNYTQRFAANALDSFSKLMGVPPPSVERFYLPLPSNSFDAFDKKTSRRFLGIPPNKFVILFMASEISQPRKGLHLLLKALEKLSLEDSFLICIGNDDTPVKHLPSDKAMFSPYIEDIKRLTSLYSAADVFIGPSLQEAFGQVYIEAAACGTPSIGFPTGGVAEAIKHGISGLIARDKTIDALADALEHLYRDRTYLSHLSAWGKLYVDSFFTLENTAAQLQRLIAKKLRENNIKLVTKLFPPKVPGRSVNIRNLKKPLIKFVSGIDSWEGPFTEWNLPRIRWSLGPETRLALHFSKEGKYALIFIAKPICRNQVIEVYQDHNRMQELYLPEEKFQILKMEVEAPKGTLEYSFRYRSSYQEEGGGRRQISVAFSDYFFVPIK